MAYDLLLHCDGTAASTSFPDSGGSARTVTAHGAAQVATQAVFASQSLQLAADTDYLSVDTGSWAFGTGDFCVDFHVRLTSATEARMFFDGGTGGFQILYDGSTLQFKSAAGTITSAAGLAASTNYHIAVTRGSGSTRLFKDGVQQGSTLTDSTNYATSAGYPRVGGAGGFVLDAATVAWAAAVVAAGGTVSSGRKTIIDTLIKGLKTDGLWSKFDRLWVTAAENPQSALTDLVGLTTTTVVNSTLFNPDGGYSCLAPTYYLNTGYNPSTNAVQLTLNTGHISHWTATPGQSSQPGVSSGGANIYEAYPDGNSYFRINNNAGGAGVTVDTGAGLFVAVRTAASGSGAILGYRDGVNVAIASDGTVALDNIPFFIYDRRSFAASVGALLSGTDVTNFYNRMLAYMTATGALANGWAAVVTASSGAVSYARRPLIDALIKGLVADGLWTKLDRIWIFAAENSQSALTDLKALATATATNAPAFTTDVGYTFNGSTNYINTGFSPTSAPLSTLNSAHISAWAVTTNTGTLTGTYDGTQGDIVSFTTSWVIQINDNNGVTTGVTSPSTGLAIATRTASNVRKLYLNGSNVFSDAVASTAEDVSGVNIWVGANSGFGGINFGAGQIAAVTYGAGLTATDAANLYSRLNTYLTAVSAGLSASTIVSSWVSAVVAAGGSVSSGRQTILNTLITGLISDGVWQKLDRLWMLAAENSQSALIDLVAHTQASGVNSPTFTTDRGFTGNGTSAYLDSGIAGNFGAGNFVYDHASYFGWSNTAGLDGGCLIGCGLTAPESAIVPAYNDGSCYAAIHDSGGWDFIFANSGATGLYLVNRTDALTSTIDINGSQATATNTTTQGYYPATANFVALAGGGGTVYSSRQCSCWGFGGQLSSGDRSNIYTRLRTYMTAVGVP